MSCPICNRPAHPEYRPFCSRRCADVDLGRWLTGAYAIPAAEDEPGDAAGEDGSPRPPPDNGAEPRPDPSSPPRPRR